MVKRPYPQLADFLRFLGGVSVQFHATTPQLADFLRFLGGVSVQFGADPRVLRRDLPRDRDGVDGVSRSATAMAWTG